MTEIDGQQLDAAAAEIMERAYAPYSRFKFGDAGLLEDGPCRQLLWGNGYPDTLIPTPGGIMTFEQILPQAFGPDDLIERGETGHISD